jgi:hypothetical protein
VDRATPTPARYGSARGIAIVQGVLLVASLALVWIDPGQNPRFTLAFFSAPYVLGLATTWIAPQSIWTDLWCLVTGIVVAIGVVLVAMDEAFMVLPAFLWMQLVASVVFFVCAALGRLAALVARSALGALRRLR